MISIEKPKNQATAEKDYLLAYQNIKQKFQQFSGWPNSCARTVRTFLRSNGVNTSSVTDWADTIRTLGKVSYNRIKLLPGDVIATGTPGDTRHVGVFLGNGKVLHQSASRGYEVGAYNDLDYFLSHWAGFYFVRPTYPESPQVPAEFLDVPVLIAPDIGENQSPDPIVIDPVTQVWNKPENEPTDNSFLGKLLL
jgi:cell wall-associated NlpC family hydrolase